ncbi:aminotransferase [Ensifer soli]|uniref:aminotransferase n=1 Tax=Ciceribacter sp. sgz301302 TaxID=3342379 RepID=UPI0035B748B3
MSSLNPLIRRLAPPPIPAAQAWARDYDGERGPLIDLSQAAPGHPPHPDLLSWLGEASASAAAAGYGPIEGERALRLAYAQHLGTLYDTPVSATAIQITAGCNQAFVAALMAVARAGDTVLITNPFYFNHQSTLSMLGIEAELLPCNSQSGFLPDIRAIDAALRPDVKALALVSPNNPTGAVYPPALIGEIFELCRANGTWLILDETYRDFLPPGAGKPHGLFAIDGWQKNFISLYSFSKSHAVPGHRVGAITAGVGVLAQVAKIMDNLQICAPRPAQIALAKALPALEGWREANRAEIAARAAALRMAIEGVEGWKLLSVGAYFAYLRHPFGDIRAQLVAERLAASAGILCLPGEFFGEAQEGHLRLAFPNADLATIRQVGERLGGFVMPGI